MTKLIDSKYFKMLREKYRVRGFRICLKETAEKITESLKEVDKNDRSTL